MFVRTRRLRRNALTREMVKNISIETSSLIYPLFICEGENIKSEIESMPEQFRYSLDRLNEELDDLLKLGINNILLFGIPNHKDEIGSQAYDENGIVQRAVRQIRKDYQDKFLVVTDVCMCEYTSHGHCGILHNHDVDNDKTLKYIAKIALSHAEAGADIIAPSDMMDGRVRKISEVLSENGFNNIPIMCYSIKYSSSFYGPFREAAGSAPKFGDRKSYQMDFRYSGDALSEVEADLMQGADMVIIKPAMAYLDILYKIKGNFGVPVIAYSVSGEYSMIKAAAINGWIDEKSIVMEQMYAFKRAGANAVITYFAKDVARYLDEG